MDYSLIRFNPLCRLVKYCLKIMDLHRPAPFNDSQCQKFYNSATRRARTFASLKIRSLYTQP